MSLPLIRKKQGLYCPDGNFYIDAHVPVPVCLITHAHADHAISGHGNTITATKNLALLKYRVGNQYPIQTYPYGQKFKMGKCWVSFHHAGHILGSAQIRIETANSVCVVSGDYKRAPDPTCDPFEVVPCNSFVTESTFALPIYQWESSDVTIQKIYQWWMANRERNMCSILYCYALGKAQRIMALLAKLTNEPIYVHGAILSLSEVYAQEGISLIPYLPIAAHEGKSFSGDLILAPPSARGSAWLNRFYPYKSAFASGWMLVRGTRKQRNVDQGFILSDHADWTDLIRTIEETQATQILTMHGNTQLLARYLQEKGYTAKPFETAEVFEGVED